MITIHVRLHGILRDRLPPEAKGRTSLEVPDSATISAVLEQLSLLRRTEVAVNDEIVDNLDRLLKEGDRLDVFRPAAGGSEKWFDSWVVQ